MEINENMLKKDKRLLKREMLEITLRSGKKLI